MQGRHHFAGAVVKGREIIHAEQGQGGQQADLAGAMDRGVTGFLMRRETKGQNDNDGQEND